MEPTVTEARLPVVSDEPNIRDLLALSPRLAGYEVFSAGDGTEVLRLATIEKPDLVIPDIMLPDMGGFTVTRRLRVAGIDMPTLFLTAKDDMCDEVEGLQADEDDYVTKPFGLEEAVVRINAVLRRTKYDSSEQPLLRVADLELDDNLYEAHRNGRLIDLPPTELKPLRYLMVNEGRVVLKSQILDHVWEYDWEGDAAIVESYIFYLRCKLDVPDEHGNIPPSLIQTRRGVGYLLRDPNE